MQGYVFTLTDSELKNTSVTGGYPYAKNQRSRWVSFDFEESSIDLGTTTDPRFVIDDKVYSIYHQYFIKEGNSTIRLIILKRITFESENVTFSDQ